jgi:putative ABC transport system permease protein
VTVGLGLCQALRFYVPALPVHTPFGYVLLALAVSLVVGVASGLLPARKASSLDPVVALTAE